MASTTPAAPAAPAAEPAGKPSASTQAAPAAPSQIRPIPPGAKPGGGTELAAPAAEPSASGGSQRQADQPEMHDAPPGEAPSLPGVVTRHGNDLFPDLRRKDVLEAAEDDDTPIDAPLDRRSPVRGPDGKFLPADSQIARPAEAKPAAPAAPAADPKAAAPAAQPAQPIKIGTREFPSIEEAARTFESLQAESRKYAEERDYGYRAGHAWKEVAERAQAELQAIREGRAPAQGQGQAGQPAAARQPGQPQAPAELLQPVLDSLGDMADFESIAFSEGLPAAGRHLAAQVLRVTAAHLLPALRAEMQEQMAPLASSHQAQRVAAHTESLIAQAQTYRTPSGEVAFPELSDADTLRAMGKLWRDSGNAPEAALTPNGVLQMVALYRLTKSLSGQQAAAPQLPAGATVASVDPAAAALAGPAATALSDGEGQPPLPPNAGRANGSPQSVLERALNDPFVRDPVLGFSRNRPMRG